MKTYSSSPSSRPSAVKIRSTVSIPPAPLPDGICALIAIRNFFLKPNSPKLF
jgi:hypothetical protein